MKRITALLLALCLLMAVAACSTKAPPESSQPVEPSTEQPSEEPSAEPKETIKIGHIVDLQGSEALTGEEARRSLQFAVDLLGGEINGHPVEIVVEDARGDVTGSVDAARKLVENDGVVALFGPTQAGQKAAVAEYVKEAGVPLIFYSGSPSYLFMGNDWLVGAGGANEQMPTVMADYTYNELGYRSVHTITMDNVGFRSFTDYYAAAFTALGGSIVSDQYAPFPSPDWAPYFTGMSDADAIMAWTTGSDAISFWTTWEAMNVNERLPVTAVLHGAFTDYFILNALENGAPAAAEAMLGTVAPTMYVYNLDTPENKAFVEAWVEEFGAVPQTNLPGLCYQAYLLFHAAVEATDGDTSPEVLIDAIFAADVTGPAGRLYFDGSHAATKDVYVVETVKLEDGSYNYSILKEYKNVPPAGLGS